MPPPSISVRRRNSAPRSLRFVFLFRYRMILSRRRRSRSCLLLLYFRPQTKPRSAIIKVCFPCLISSILYPTAHALASAAHALASSSSISVRRQNPGPLSSFLHHCQALRKASMAPRSSAADLCRSRVRGVIVPLGAGDTVRPVVICHVKHY